MRRALVLALLVPASASAFEAEPQELLIYDQVPLLEGAVYETGYLPSGSAVSINIALQANQLADVEMGVVAGLSWPEVVTLAWEGIPGTGFLSVFGELALVTTLRLDLWGYEGEWELDRRSIDVVAETGFDPMLLAGGTPESVSVTNEGQGTSVIELTYEPFSGVSVGVLLDVRPYMEVDLAGIEVAHNGVAFMTREGETVVLDVPPDGDLEVASEYLASWYSDMDVLIVPVLQACVSYLGCYEVDAFEVSIDMDEGSFEDPFEPAIYDFPLPVMGAVEGTHDFGEVEVGNLANWVVEVPNAGVAWLEGEAGVTGASAFSVAPGDVLVAQDGTDAFVVTFAPEEAGAFTGTLVLATNDPASPTVEISLAGTGVEPVEQDCSVVSSEVGCGCGTAGHTGTWALAFLVLPALAARRRTHVR